MCVCDGNAPELNDLGVGHTRTIVTAVDRLAVTQVKTRTCGDCHININHIATEHTHSVANS